VHLKANMCIYTTKLQCQAFYWKQRLLRLRGRRYTTDYSADDSDGGDRRPDVGVTVTAHRVPGPREHVPNPAKLINF